MPIGSRSLFSHGEHCLRPQMSKSVKVVKISILAVCTALQFLSEAYAAGTFEISARGKNTFARARVRAIVYIPTVLGKRKKIDVVIYNHGYGATAAQAIRNGRLREQILAAGQPFVLVAPEWQRFPGSRRPDQGVFEKAGTADQLLQKAFIDLPELRGKSIASIIILSHSAGYGPTETELYKNNLSAKVKVVALLDSLYDVSGFDPWLSANIKALSSGKKRFYNIFNDTDARSLSQVRKVRELLSAAGLDGSSVYEDYNKGAALIASSIFREKPIVFKFSSYVLHERNSQLGNPHDSIPAVYIAPILRASGLTGNKI